MAKHLIAISALALGACSQVETGHRGVFTEFGEPTGQVSEGLHWYNPVTTDLVEIDVRQKAWRADTVAYTEDVQQAEVDFTLLYSLQPDKALETYQKVGKGWRGILISPVVYQTVKDVLGASKAVEDAIQKRGEIQANIRERLTSRLAERNIIVHGFEINDIDFTKEFEEANEQKQIAVEMANAAKNRTVEVEEKAKQRIIAAQADAEAMKIKTQALAGNAKLVEYEAVQKWDGKLPRNMYGEGAVPFIQTK